MKNSLPSVGVTSSFLALLYEPVQGFARYPVVLFANFDNLDACYLFVQLNGSPVALTRTNGSATSGDVRRP